MTTKLPVPVRSGLPHGYDFDVRLDGRSVTVELVRSTLLASNSVARRPANFFVPIDSTTLTPPSWFAWLFGDRLHLRVRQAGRELARRAWEREAATKPPPDRTPRKYRANDIVKGYQPTEGMAEDAEPPKGGSGVRYPATVKVTKVSRGTLDSLVAEEVEVAEGELGDPAEEVSP